MSKPFVAILMGSDSDLPKVQAAIDVLKKLNVGVEVRVHSAHRTPDATHEYVKGADQRGCAAFIACAGMAAHLAGVVASLTIKPVIGVPIDAGPLNGMDALLSTAQMPGGIPVATVAIGKAGAKNAGYLAAQIIALQDPDLAERLRGDRKANADEVLAKNEALQETLA
ncbi:5-(carboxyamino)imidazole ribonucleotide mutase [Aestuariirhabdus litorea]|uniref:N5-carboxyaminoimidazole ribonucleotide mutase n=1 Tax=Aestuariirhabdus litorea TaxID=2528527 RepID=A0A3P3VL24_9GAMM|nr:5-(carboxyamino)imidazole ribonucleotide mutase [Aestuariirhabdus litorea]RRJ82578.1 5-(carboxyamino)imidazole ribonucleotide mutase [Aestuariirhabdus litorea]RWW92736.1 5-(carboxyamino)imidazole ribonucleotide mutase [Endozoicomonadaceae bacterium GTF-13]